MELQLCQRYYQEIGKNANNLWVSAQYNSSNWWSTVQYRTEMRANPTITKSGAGTPQATYISTDSVSYQFSTSTTYVSELKLNAEL